MKKCIFGIFAHPDDEAFGPSGTLLKLGREGYDIHLILLTDGDAGVNIDNVPNLATTRLGEWQTSARLLHAKTEYALHYPDGALDQVTISELDKKVGQIITHTTKSYSQPVELSLMTFEPNGLTGHRDHIAASMLTTRVSRQCNAHQVWYFCLDSTQAPLEKSSQLAPCAREEGYLNQRVDVSEVLDEKYRVMDAHVSQRQDAKTIKALGFTTECFCVEQL